MLRLLLYFALLLTLTGCTPTNMNNADRLTQQTLNVKGQSVVVDVASTPIQQQQGLSGRKQLVDGMGMLFPFDNPIMQTFWMKDMLFAIDIVWIADQHVIGIEPDVVADDGLIRYTSPAPVDMVLELPAGWSERYGLQIGDAIR